MTPRYDELLRRLVGGEVRFVLVGGLALSAWGVIRGTRDVDVVPDPDTDNLLRLARVLFAAGAQVHHAKAFVSSLPALEAMLLGDERVLAETDLGMLDVVRGLPGVPPYARLRANATEVELGGVAVPVCSLEDLRAMKRAAGRPRDLADLADLDAAHAPGDEPPPDGSRA